MVKGSNGSQQEAKNADKYTINVNFCTFIVSVDNVGGNILDFNSIPGV